MILEANIGVEPGSLLINGAPVGAVDVITMGGLESIASCLGAPFSMSAAWMPYIAIGADEWSPSTEDKFLWSELVRKLGGVSYTGDSYIVQVTFQPNEPTSNCIVREVGILSAAKGGILGARWVLDTEVVKETVDTLSVSCNIKFYYQ